MKSKDKKIITVIFIFITIICVILVFYNLYYQKNKAYTVSSKIEKQNSSQIISNAKKIDVDAIIEQNVENKKPEEYRQEEVVLEYLTEYVTNPEVPQGELHIIQEGVKGTQKIIYKKIYENDELVGEEQVSAEIVKSACKQIIEIGSGSKKAKTVIKVGDKVSVTSDELTVTTEPDENSRKIAKLIKDDQPEVLKIQGDWYYIKHLGTEGWIKKIGTKAITIEPEEEQGTKVTLQNLNFNIQLNKPSGLSLEQFKKILTDSKDKNKIFSQNAQYFYYIEQQYKINGVFVAAMGIHESAWGTSKIAKDKKNLFGYGAYDSNPYNGAYQFSNYSESIDLIARVLVKYYLNPKGTNIYGGEKAVGSFYNGATLSGVNKKYASDKNWANGVYTYMQYLYGKM